MPRAIPRRLATPLSATFAVWGAYLAFFASWYALKPGGEEVLVAFSDYAVAAASLTAAVVCAAGARSLRAAPRTRTAWYLVAAAWFFTGLGDGIWTYLEIYTESEVLFPSWPDIPYLTFYPLLLAGLVLQPVAGGHAAGRLRLAMDGLIGSLGLLTLAWYLLLGPLYAASEAGIGNKVIGLTYPAGDTVLLTATLLLVIRGGPKTTLPQGFLAASAAVLAITDGGFAYLELHEGYFSGHPIDLGWVVSPAFAALAAVAQATAPAGPVEEDRASVGWQLWLPYGLLAVLLGVTMRQIARGGVGSADPLFLAGVTSVAILVLVRQVLTLAENQRLYRALQVLAGRLEQLVAARTEQLTLRNTQLLTLNRAASRLVGSVDQQDIVRQALSCAQELVSADGAALWLRDHGRWRRALVLGEIGGVTRPHRQVEEGFTVVEAGRSLLYEPLKAYGSTRGQFGLARREGFEEPERALISSLAASTASALETAALYAQARAQADIDAVTGLYTHRYFQDRLELALAQSAASGVPVSVVLLDIDRCRLFNDTYGHAVGDQLLKKVAAMLIEACPEGVLVARYGGDEFALLLPGRDGPAARRLSQEVRRHVEGQPFQIPSGGRLPVTLSCGIASYPADGELRHELLAQADAGLYEAKHASRDQLSAISGGEPGQEPRQGTYGALLELVRVIDAKDHYTKRHSDFVAIYALTMADELRLSEEVKRTLRIAAVLHDVGKIAIPDRVLKKPGPLTLEEREIVERHVVLGGLIIKDVPNLQDVLNAVVHHHEKFDGSGYAKGLRGEEIPFLGRVMAVADAFSAMTLDRPYRSALTPDEAVRELKRGAGSQFDPDLVKAFLRALWSGGTLREAA